MHFDFWYQTDCKLDGKNNVTFSVLWDKIEFNICDFLLSFLAPLAEG